MARNRPANLRRHFLPWNEPLLPQAVRWLAGDWTGGAPLDLGRALVVVPTRQSGRRLRAALAEYAAERRQAAFPPRVVTPDALTADGLGPGIASRLETLLAWTEVLREIPLEEYRAVFPVDPPGRNFSWALQLAQQLARLQTAVAENGLTLADVRARLNEDFVEADRWDQLAALEKRQIERLAMRGRRHPQVARILSATTGAVAETDGSQENGPSGDSSPFERIVLLGAPDPQPLALTRLTTLAAGRPIDVVVFAPPAEAAAFDEWGRPMPAAWERRTLELPAFGDRVHLCADPAAQAARLAAVAAAYTEPDGIVALGVADPEVAPLLENELTRVNRPAFNPEGHPHARERLYELLTNLAGIAREPAFDRVAALARCPDVLAYLRNRLGPEFSTAYWLEQLDRLWSDHLPADLETARAFAGRSTKFSVAAAGLAVLAKLREQLRQQPFARAASDALGELFAGRRLNPDDEADARLQATAEAWTALVREFAAADSERIAPADAWDLLLRLLGEQRRTEEKPAGALDLLGWLELLWEDAPHLAVAGLNDGRVPEAVAEDPFLPESLRRRLELKTNAARFARDAYILQAIAAARAAANDAADASPGRQLDLFFGKTTAAGEPLRPSRLLLRCADTDLAQRIAFLFRTPELAEANAAWTRSWRLQPKPGPKPASVAVTALRRYLQCPFRFYLRHVLRMESVDPLKSELDAFDFGTLCHSALERIGRDPGLRDCTDPGVLRAELVNHLDRVVRERYGPTLSLPLIMQVESARQRVGRLAELQAVQRAAGWEIIAVERPFTLEISGIVIRGKIDRIDRHAGTGDIRVLDYKTSDTPVAPVEAHIRRLRPAEAVAQWAQFDLEGVPRTWVDLQLPLYLRALATPGSLGEPLAGLADLAAGRAVASCGYFNLPKAAGQTVLALWDDYSRTLHAAAMQCAEGACAAFTAGQFWPPNENLRADRDECAALFHNGVAESVEWHG